jgi:tetratricopeptide (TPR) repeat protein
VRTVRALFIAVAALVLVAAPAPSAPPSPAEQLAHHRNLGKAFYENPTLHAQAVEELRQARELAPGSVGDRLNYALALLRAGKDAEGIAELVAVQKLDPALPHTWWNLGIAYQNASRHDEARTQLLGMVKRVPDDAAAHYNLGVLYQAEGKAAEAQRQLEEAARLDPDMAAPHYQLASVYRRAGRGDDAARELARFRELKQAQAGAAVPEDPQWSRFSELVDPVEPRGKGATPPAPVPLALAAKEVATLPPPTAALPAGLAVLDAEGDGRPDLLAWSGGRLRLLAAGARPMQKTPLDGLQAVVAAVPGDFDNDGLADLCVLESRGARLWRNAGGRFAAASAALPAGAWRAAAWLDFDHDYDLDLLLLGDPGSDSKGGALLRNNGDGSWADATARFPFVAGRALSAAVLDTVADSQGEDLVVSYEGRAGVLYRDELGGRYDAEPLPALPAGARDLAAADIDGDGWTDIVAATADRRPLLLLNGGDERQARSGWRALPPPAAARAPALLADLENRGVVDIVAGGAVHFGGPGGALAASATPLLGAAAKPAAPDALAAADFDGDGRTDVALLARGALRLLANRTAGAGRWLGVGLKGVKNLRLAAGAEVEVKAGASYQKRRYAGVPLLFGLGRRDAADTVRITWPNGLIQNETRQPAGAVETYAEAPRLSGSCPMIFTWDGSRFRFLTDVLGVAPLGASAGDGEYFPVDHDEYVQVPGETLVAVDGRYRVQVTEELREVSYLDQIQLVAVDHPADVEVFTNDKFVGPPFPDLRLFGVRRRIHPVRATDGAGADVRERLLARDGRYPDGFRRDFAGVADVHHLELDFGDAAPDGRAVLVLSGWVDWADGSTFLGSAQRQGGGLLMPQLQVEDERGEWQTVIADLGIPAGKPKSIVVDLTGRFLSASRRVRIVTNLCVYWDEIFLAEDAAEPTVALTRLAPAGADLHFRGFSTPTIHPQRKQPESFDYDRLLATTMWNPTPGNYTRYGDVRALLADVDDLLVVMGSGDEVSLDFDADALPPLPAGWRRDFLLLFDGWAKDADANTAFSQSVEPLPFHGMSRYPYPAEERFPDDELHRRWREETLVRPALRLLRPLGDDAARPPG